ncbi:MAG: bactofilin family protein [Blautia sp.]
MEWTSSRQKERIQRMEISHLIAAGRVWNLKCVGRDETGQDGFLRASILTWYDLVIRKGYVVQGNIRCHKNVTLQDGAVVCGDVTADGDITVGKHVRIYGSVRAKKNITIHEGAVIGREGIRQFVAARGDLRISENCCIYGKVQAQKKIRVFSLTKEKESARR